MEATTKSLSLNITAMNGKIYVEGWNRRIIYIQFAEEFLIATGVPVQTLHKIKEYCVKSKIIQDLEFYLFLKKAGLENVTLRFVKVDNKIYTQYIARLSQKLYQNTKKLFAILAKSFLF